MRTGRGVPLVGWVIAGLLLAGLAATTVRLALAERDGGKQVPAGAAPAATLSPEQRDRLYHAGPEWDGKGTGRSPRRN